NAGAGSPYYMAPEQILRQPADRRADVFSLGVVLYELLTDEKPFRGDTLKDIRHAVLMLEPPLANKVDSGVPKALAEIAARAMAKDPEHRFRSARSFARELRQWLDANPVLAEGATVPAAPGAPPRRRARTLAWAAASLLTLAVGSVVGWQTTLTPVPVPVRGVDTAVAAKPAATTVVPIVTALPPTVEVDVFDAPGAASSPAPVAMAAPAAVATVTAPAAVARVVPPVASPVVPHVVSTSLPAAAAAVPPRESLKERRARELREREVRDRDQRLAAATQLVAPATGTVRIAISPWGQVEVDGNASGAAPPLTELTLSEGRHQIVVRNGDFAPYATSVNVVAGQAVSLRYKFGP
ncbi:MAG: protein kinase, partial [Caldimonas sp.]